MVHKSSVDIELGAKQLQYFECSKNIPLQVKATGPKTLRIISRLMFSEEMGSQESYRIHVKSGQKVVGTYFLTQSDQAVPRFNLDLILCLANGEVVS